MDVDRSSIILETESRDTKDHARFLREIVGEEAFVLVTSAAHTPRSMALFEGAGLNPIAAPTNFTVVGDIKFGMSWFVPKQGRIKTAENAFYEYMGIAWAKLRGQS